MACSWKAQGCPNFGPAWVPWLIHPVSAGPFSCISQLCFPLRWRHSQMASSLSLARWLVDKSSDWSPEHGSHWLLVESRAHPWDNPWSLPGQNPEWSQQHVKEMFWKSGREGFPEEWISGCYKYRRGKSCQEAKATKFLHTGLSKLNEGHPGKRKGCASWISHGFSPHMDKLIWAIRLCFHNGTLKIHIWRGRNKRQFWSIGDHQDWAAWI